MSRIRVNIDVDQAWAMYESGLTMNAVAQKVGCSHNTIRNRFKAAGLKVRSQTPLPARLEALSVLADKESDLNAAVKVLDHAGQKDKALALYTALQTEFAEQLMDECLAHWLKYREEKPEAKALFVTARIEDARRCMDYLKSMEIPSLLATSHDAMACVDNINLFKTRAPVLVTIAVAYEGLDVPAVSHVCVLTRIRSKEWMEQCVSRATRVHKKSGPYHSQAAHIFAPKDPAFIEFVDAIEKEQVTQAQAPKKTEEQLDLFPVEEEQEESTGPAKGPCIPLKSQILELSRRVIGTGATGGFIPEIPVIQTPKQMELGLRKRIDRHLKAYAIAQGYEFPRIMRDVKTIFNGKPRGQLTLEELKVLWAGIKQRYPLEYDGGNVHQSGCPPFSIQPLPQAQTMEFF